MGICLSYFNNRDQRLLEESANELKGQVATPEDFEFECHSTRELMAFKENKKMAIFCAAMGKSIPEELLGDMVLNQSMMKDIEKQNSSMHKVRSAVKVHFHLNMLKKKTKGMKKYVAKSNRNIQNADKTLDEKDELDEQLENVDDETSRIIDRIGEGSTSAYGDKSLYANSATLADPEDARSKLMAGFGLDLEDEEENDREREKILKSAPSVVNEDHDDNRPTNQGMGMLNSAEGEKSKNRNKSKMSERDREETEGLLFAE